LLFVLLDAALIDVFVSLIVVVVTLIIVVGLIVVVVGLIVVVIVGLIAVAAGLIVVFAQRLQVNVCIVSAVSFNGQADCTYDPLVQEAFKEAVYVSTGIPSRYVDVATPAVTELCGIDLLALVTTGKRGLLTSDATDKVLQQQQQRRSELFGVSDVDALRVEVTARLDSASRWTVSASLPVVYVYFSVTSNVEGMYVCMYVCMYACNALPHVSLVWSNCSVTATYVSIVLGSLQQARRDAYTHSESIALKIQLSIASGDFAVDLVRAAVSDSIPSNDCLF